MVASIHPSIDHATACPEPCLGDIDIEETHGPQVLLSQEGGSSAIEPPILCPFLGTRPIPEDSSQWASYPADLRGPERLARQCFHPRVLRFGANMTFSFIEGTFS